MTVYVCPLRGAGGRLLACPMSADTQAELHDAVFRIGIQRRYKAARINLTESQCGAAIAAGAVEVSADIFAKMDFCRRKTRKPCTPEEARSFYAGWMAERSAKAARKARATREMRNATHG